MKEREREREIKKENKTREMEEIWRISTERKEREVNWRINVVKNFINQVSFLAFLEFYVYIQVNKFHSIYCIIL